MSSHQSTVAHQKSLPLIKLSVAKESVSSADPHAVLSSLMDEKGVTFELLLKGSKMKATQSRKNS